MIAATVKILESHAPPLNMVHHHVIKSVILCDVDILHSQKYWGEGRINFGNFVVFRNSPNFVITKICMILKVLFQGRSFEKRPSAVTMQTIVPCLCKNSVQVAYSFLRMTEDSILSRVTLTRHMGPSCCWIRVRVSSHMATLPLHTIQLSNIVHKLYNN